jgi:flagellar L-ring protein precursor FlgH
MAAARAAALVLAACGGPALANDDAQSMFDEQTYQSLVAETKAHHVGDVLTVVVQESASATSTTDLRAQRDLNANAHIQLTGFPGRSPDPHAITGGTSSNSDGSGSTQRTGQLLAQLSVRVLEVAPNGDLSVAGQQSLKINGEEQLITLSGHVRPQDVAADNTVLSNRIAEARIQFDGKGFVTDQARPSWIARLLTFLGL